VSVTAEAISLAPTQRNRLLARLALALGAVAAVAGGIALLF
jgi:hypothetical protein